MHRMLIEVLAANRLEGPRPYVQGDLDSWDPLCLQAGEQVFVEMQTRRRRRHGPLLAGVNGLVTRLIEQPVRPRDVGR